MAIIAASMGRDVAARVAAVLSMGLVHLAVAGGIAAQAEVAVSGTHAAGIRHRCRSIAIDVVASSWREIKLVCSSARRTARFLARSGLRFDTALRVDVVKELRTEQQLRCFGRFHPEERLIEVLGLQQVRETRHACPSHAAISPSALFGSVIAHEVTHAVVDQHRPSLPLQRVAQEYIAYVTQISVMSRHVRRAFVGAVPVKGAGSLEDLSELSLVFHPAGFAVRAYRHYQASMGRHRMLADIVAGTFRFPATEDAAD